MPARQYFKAPQLAASGADLWLVMRVNEIGFDSILQIDEQLTPIARLLVDLCVVSQLGKVAGGLGAKHRRVCIGKNVADIASMLRIVGKADTGGHQYRASVNLIGF